MRRKHTAPSVSFFAFQDIITSVVGIFVLIALIMILQLIERTVEGQTSSDQVADQLSETLSLLRVEVDSLRQQCEKFEQSLASTPTVNRFNAASVMLELDQATEQSEARIKRSLELADQVQQSLIEAEGQNHQLVEESVVLETDREELKRLIEKTQWLESQLGKLDTEDPLVFRKTSMQGKTLVVMDIRRTQVRILDLAGDKVTNVKDESGVENWLKQRRLDSLHFLLLVRPDGVGQFDDCRQVIESHQASYGFDVLNDSKTIRMASEVGATP